MWKDQFCLFQDERVLWRCGGGLQNATLNYSAKHLILLDRRYHLTVLVVRDAHRQIHHNGVHEILNEIRSQF